MTPGDGAIWSPAADRPLGERTITLAGHARGGMVERYLRALNLAIEAGGSCQGATIEAWPTVSVQKSSSSFRMKNAASRLDLRSCRPRNFALKNASSLR